MNALNTPVCAAEREDGIELLSLEDLIEIYINKWLQWQGTIAVEDNCTQTI